MFKDLPIYACLFLLWDTLQHFKYISCFFLLHIQIVIFPSFHTSFLFLIMKFIKGQGGRKKERNFSFALTELLHLEMYFFLSWTSGVTVTLNKKTSFNNGFKLHNNFHLIYLFSDSCC